jgi:hypothetical protein
MVRRQSHTLAEAVVADEDVPESARMPPNEEGEEGGETAGESNPLEKKATPKRTKADADADGEVKEPKPKKVRVPYLGMKGNAPTGSAESQEGEEAKGRGR